MSLIELLLHEIESDEQETISKEDVIELRKRLGLNTTQISKLIGVSKRTWERYESGAYQINESSWVYLKMISNELPGIRVLKIGV